MTSPVAANIFEPMNQADTGPSKGGVVRDLNMFLRSVNVPDVVVVTEDDVRIDADSAIISKTIYDVQISVTVPHTVLNHLAMAMGVISAFGSKESP